MTLSPCFRSLVPLLAAIGAWLTVAGCNAPPATERVEVVDEIHGVKVSDPYRWLEDESDPRVAAWLGRQREYTRKILDRDPRREALKQRFADLLSVTSISRPAVYRQRYLFSKRQGTQNQAVIYVREGSHRAPARAILDPNTWSADGTLALDWMHPTPDASLIAYGRSQSGDEKSTLYILDVATGKLLADEIPYTRHCSLAWDPDMKGFLYSRYPEPGTVPPGDENYYHKMFHHRLGDDWRKDPLVVGDLAQKEEAIDVDATSDNRYVLLQRSVDWAKNDLYLRPLGTDGPFTPVAVGLDGQVSGDSYQGRLFLQTNIGAPRSRIVVTDVENPAPDHWKDVVPQQKGVIEGFRIVGGRLFVGISEDVHSRLAVYDLDGTFRGDIELPTLGTVGGINGEPDGQEMFFSFESFAWPPTNYRYDVQAGRLEEIERMEVKADLTPYDTRQVWYTSKDSTRIPMFIIARKDVALDGSHPTVLYGYGGFDISLVPQFNSRIIPWLEAGGVYAIANLRGGGEFGRAWHQAGRLEKKQNVFDDFIAAGEALVAMKYTTPRRLAIYGGSNGGLLVGACLVQRPDLFGAAVCAVPLLDMVRYHQFAIARLWIPEYGTAEDPNQFKWLYAYSPYHHVQEGVDYPATLLMTGASDSRVQPMHACKMAAALQHVTTGNRPILLRVEEKAGHGQGKPLSKRIEEQADIWTFLMAQLNVR